MHCSKTIFNSAPAGHYLLLRHDRAHLPHSDVTIEPRGGEGEAGERQAATQQAVQDHREGGHGFRGRLDAIRLNRTHIHARIR